MWFDASKIRLEPPANSANPANRQDKSTEKGWPISRISEISSPSNPANDPTTILVECWTPSGIRRLVYADSHEHAEWIRASNPKPRQVRCADCDHANVTNGIASCGAGVDSGLATGGWWATDRHLCGQFEEARP
jgi:hypothetical protein